VNNVIKCAINMQMKGFGLKRIGGEGGFTGLCIDCICIRMVDSRHSMMILDKVV